jgi:predicted PolB exonuclease-like 3'-5' exonuclease
MAKKVLAFDLETIADKQMLDFLPDVKSSGRGKSIQDHEGELAATIKSISDEGFTSLPARSQQALQTKMNKSQESIEKILLDLKSKEDRQKVEMGLEPTQNMICCAAWADDKGTGSILLKEETYEAEKQLLLDFWAVLAQYDHFITFNGRSFDIRCMLLHGMTHGIRPAVNIDKGRYNRGNHTDLRLVLAGDGMFAKGKMDFFAKKFLGRGKTEGIDGQQVQTYWDLGLYEEIVEYNEEDCQITLELFRMAEIAGLLE